MEDKTPWDQQAGLDFLCRRDKRLARVIRRVGACTWKVQTHRNLLATLAEAIISQQLSSKAAATIYARFCTLFPTARGKPGLPKAEQILQLDDQQLRAVGLSHAKILAVKDLATKVLQQQVPRFHALSRLDDEAVIQHLIQVRGIGRWTAEMFLIFHLGRPDVLPLDDLGVRKGFMVTYQLDALPDRQQLVEQGELWRPYRSLASWYLWRATELS